MYWGGCSRCARVVRPSILRVHAHRPGLTVKATPVSGMFFPGPVQFFPEFAVAPDGPPVNALASKYLTTWFGSLVDASCAAALVRAARR